MNKRNKASMLLAILTAMTGKSMDDIIDQAMNDTESEPSINLEKMKIKETEDV